MLVNHQTSFLSDSMSLCLDHMRVIWVCGGKIWGCLKCFRESLDCCHSGKDTTIKLSSEVTHRSGGKDQLLTMLTLISTYQKGLVRSSSSSSISIDGSDLDFAFKRTSDKAFSVSQRTRAKTITGSMLTQTDPPTVHSHTDYADCSRCDHPQLSLTPSFFFFCLLFSPLFRKGHS